MRKLCMPWTNRYIKKERYFKRIVGCMAAEKIPLCRVDWIYQPSKFTQIVNAWLLTQHEKATRAEQIRRARELKRKAKKPIYVEAMCESNPLEKPHTQVKPTKPMKKRISPEFLRLLHEHERKLRSWKHKRKLEMPGAKGKSGTPPLSNLEKHMINNHLRRLLAEMAYNLKTSANCHCEESSDSVFKDKRKSKDSFHSILSKSKIGGLDGAANEKVSSVGIPKFGRVVRGYLKGDPKISWPPFSTVAYHKISGHTEQTGNNRSFRNAALTSPASNENSNEKRRSKISSKATLRCEARFSRKALRQGEERIYEETLAKRNATEAVNKTPSSTISSMWRTLIAKKNSSATNEKKHNKINSRNSQSPTSSLTYLYVSSSFPYDKPQSPKWNAKSVARHEKAMSPLSKNSNATVFERLSASVSAIQEINNASDPPAIPKTAITMTKNFVEENEGDKMIRLMQSLTKRASMKERNEVMQKSARTINSSSRYHSTRRFKTKNTNPKLKCIDSEELRININNEPYILIRNSFQ